MLGFRPELIEHQLADAVETYAVHTYSPDHIYRLYVTGDGKPLSFYISDLDYAGNFGALTVRITPVKKNKN